IKIKELKSPGLKVVGQIVDLSYVALSTGDLWRWNDGYISTTDTGEPLVTIPGTHLYPLKPEVQRSESESSGHRWILRVSYLEKVASKLWELLDPELDEILVTVDALPSFPTSKLPYRAEGHPKLLIYNASSLIVKKCEGSEVVACNFCSFLCPLKLMQNHVGTHILRVSRNRSDIAPYARQIGPNPCGWYGLGQCKTQFKSTGRNQYAILSDCNYHY
ncbi:hypothetical protein B0H34DRAFT_832820, partial [Crassisporium funariophilum]